MKFMILFVCMYAMRHFTKHSLKPRLRTNIANDDNNKNDVPVKYRCKDCA